MVQCAICKKTDEETSLNQGIYQGKVIRVCEFCSKMEDIPLIRKPKEEQIEMVERSISVRERLEKLSKQDERTKTLSTDQETATQNMGKIQFPRKKQESDSLVENYYWKIQHARRLKKLSLSQVSEETGISIEMLDDMEKGQLSKNFESIAKILEDFYGIEVLKTKQEPENPEEKIQQEIPVPKKYNPVTKTFSYSQDEINKTDETANEEPSQEEKQKKQELKQKISHGKFDFSKRENLKDINLNDLIEIKRAKEKQEQKEKQKKQRDDLLGKDVELEND